MTSPTLPTLPTPTTAQIAQHYSAAMDSVNLINQIVAQPTKTVADVDTVNRNTSHLKIMLAKTFWTTENLAPLTAASTVTVVATPS
jgi:hypothetical protein